MTFERPDLLALAPVAVLLVALGATWQWRRRGRLVAAFGGDAAVARLVGRDVGRYPAKRLAYAVGGCLALSVAAAGPRATTPPPVPVQPLDLVVVVDISLSMATEDVEPSRAARAVDVLRRLTEIRPNDRLAVTVFADWPYTLVPLTHDLDVVRFFGGTLGPPLVADRDQGSGLGAAVTHARSTLDRRRDPEAAAGIVLVSDGEAFADPSTVIDAVTGATADGVRLWTAGIGSAEGGEIFRPEAPGTPVVDERGRPVVSRMDADLLREMAAAGGGAFFDVSADAGLEALLDAIGRGPELEPSEGRLPGPGVILALLALPLLLLEGSADRARRSGRRRS